MKLYFNQSILGLFIFLLACNPDPSSNRSSKIIFDEEITLNDASFRGADIKFNKAIVSGSEGSVYMMELERNEWKKLEIKNTDSLDFRDVALLSDKEILLMSAGAGEMSRIYRSEDAGKSWTLVYENESPSAFYNSMDFWDNKHGIITSDPIDQKPYLLETKDGGLSWIRLFNENLPDLLPDEYGFAASGTIIKTFGKNSIRIATGGGAARIFMSDDGGLNWSAENTPIIQGKNSMGIFSIDYKDKNTAIAVGGDYLEDQQSGENIALLNENKEWALTEGAADIGFMSCVKYLDKNLIIATGTSGTAISYDQGKNWEYIKEIKGYHTIAYDKNKKTGILAGGNGKVRVFQIK